MISLNGKIVFKNTGPYVLWPTSQPNQLKVVRLGWRRNRPTSALHAKIWKHFPCIKHTLPQQRLSSNPLFSV